MATIIRMPEVLANTPEAVIAEWQVAEGAEIGVVEHTRVGAGRRAGVRGQPARRAPTPAPREACEELGQTLAASIAFGLF